MSKLSGYQVLSAEAKDVARAACMVVTIEIQGCKFTGTAEIKPEAPQGQDRFQLALEAAAEQAEKLSATSDFKLYGRSTGSSWGGGQGKGRSGIDPASPASSGAIGGMFKEGLKEHSYKRPEIQGLIAEALQRPYVQDLENELTHGQVETIRAKLAAGERAQQVPQHAKPSQKDKLKRAYVKAGGHDIDGWLAEGGASLATLTAEQAERALARLEAA